MKAHNGSLPRQPLREASCLSYESIEGLSSWNYLPFGYLVSRTHKNDYSFTELLQH